MYTGGPPYDMEDQKFDDAKIEEMQHVIRTGHLPDECPLIGESPVRSSKNKYMPSDQLLDGKVSCMAEPCYKPGKVTAIIGATPVKLGDDIVGASKITTWKSGNTTFTTVETSPATFPAMKLDPRAKLPSKTNSTDAGFDLHALERGGIAPKTRLTIPTGISVAIPVGWYGRIAPRSGLAHNHGIDVLAGVCDASYRGEIKVILINHGTGDFKFEAGDRIAQLVLEKCGEWQIVEVSSLTETDRGAGGFGSTGK